MARRFIATVVLSVVAGVPAAGLVCTWDCTPVQSATAGHCASRSTEADRDGLEGSSGCLTHDEAPMAAMTAAKRAAFGGPVIDVGVGIPAVPAVQAAVAGRPDVPDRSPPNRPRSAPLRI